MVCFTAFHALPIIRTIDKIDLIHRYSKIAKKILLSATIVHLHTTLRQVYKKLKSDASLTFLSFKVKLTCYLDKIGTNKKIIGV